jgi:hypothetical protein
MRHPLMTEVNNPCSANSRHRAFLRLLLAVGVAAVCLAATTACGSSSKPAYCTDRTNLENSIKGLADFHVQNGISGLESQLSKIQTDANALVSSAKSDFPSETSAIRSSIDQLSTTVKSFPSNPSPTNIGMLVSEISSTVTSVENFYNSTKSKCG